MYLQSDLFAALRGLCADRVYPNVFPQVENGTTQVWPSIRYTVTSSVPVEDLCGDGDDGTADVSVQLDAVAVTHTAMLAFRLQVLEAMRALSTARLQSSSNEYDAEVKVFRAILQYTFSGSSPA
jgi:hypothetical protein